MTKNYDLIINNKNIFTPRYNFNYFNVRNNAWEFLLKNEIKSFPLNLKEIALKNNWCILSYNYYSKTYNINEEYLIKEHPKGFFKKYKDMYIICYNQNNPRQVNRFTIAHEIGHIVLQHIYKGEQLEKEANMFAARILMPMLLIKELKITTAEELAKLCDVSLEAATNRLMRFNKEIKKRGMFYTNPREQQLYNQLKDFITKSKNT